MATKLERGPWVLDITHANGKTELVECANKMDADEKVRAYHAAVPADDHEEDGQYVNKPGIYSIVLRPA